MNIVPGSTSYFSAPSSELDPKLFQGMELESWVRTGVLSLLFDYLARHFSNPHQWTKAWLAGSGVSYQWEASREPGDLDCLVGIDYINFRRYNTDYAGYSDAEIASMFNEGFNAELMPKTRNWEGYELTFYVNPQTDIRDINPYAAYDLIGNFWTVTPEKNPQPPYSRAWEQRSIRDEETAKEMVSRYTSALEEVQRATNPAHRINAERKLQLAAEQAVTLYDDIHAGRKVAFSKIGSGYSDFNNYRWQAGKRSGIVQALRSIKELKDTSEKQSQLQTYGVELPDADTLIRRTLRN
jgi:hypothetical protein